MPDETLDPALLQQLRQAAEKAVEHDLDCHYPSRLYFPHFEAGAITEVPTREGELCLYTVPVTVYHCEGDGCGEREGSERPEGCETEYDQVLLVEVPVDPDGTLWETRIIGEAPEEAPADGQPLSSELLTADLGDQTRQLD